MFVGQMSGHVSVNQILCLPNVCWPNVKAYQPEINIWSAKCLLTKCQGVHLTTNYCVSQNVCWPNVRAWQCHPNIVSAECLLTKFQDNEIMCQPNVGKNMSGHKWINKCFVGEMCVDQMSLHHSVTQLLCWTNGQSTNPEQTFLSIIQKLMRESSNLHGGLTKKYVSKYIN